MPFLAPLAGPLIGLGGSLLGAKLGKSKPSQLEQGVIKTGQEGQQEGMNLARSITPQAQSLLQMGGGAISAPMRHWSNILSGNRSGITSALGPEISRIGEGYNEASKTSAALQPRGGARANILGDLPFRQQADVTSLMQQARPAAAQSLFSGGRDTMTAGSNLISNAVNAIYGATAAGRDILTSEQARQQRDTETGRSIGTSIFDMLKNIDFGGIFGGGSTRGRRATGGVLSPNR